MNKVKKKVYRNMTSFKMMAWGSFAFFVILMLVGLYTLKHPLMVKGYYLMGCVGLILSSFTVSKVVRGYQKMRKTITNSLPQKHMNNNRRNLKRFFFWSNSNLLFDTYFTQIIKSLLNKHNIKIG